MKWQNMTIGKKNYTGYSIILALLCVVAGISFFGIHGIVRNAGNVIDGNKLDGQLAQREVDHLIWTGKLNAFLNDDSVTELRVEKDDHKCAFGKWLYSEKRKIAENLIPSIAPYLKEIEAAHLDLHNSAVAIDKAYTSPHKGLSLFLSKMLQDHITWVATAAKNMSTEVSGLGVYQNRLENAVFQAYSILKTTDENNAAGTLEQRQEKVLSTIKNMKYGKEGNDYFWINDTVPKMIMHPYKPSLNGKNLSKSADPDGKKLFVEMVKVCREKGEGFVTYKWPKYGSDKPVPKLSFVKLYKPWGWIVGSGIYIDVTNEKLHQRINDFDAGRPFRLGVETNPLQCTFEKWLSLAETQKLRKNFRKLDAAISKSIGHHNALHAAAHKIEKHINTRDYDLAVKIFYTDIETAFEGVDKYFRKAIGEENKLRKGLEESLRIYTTQTMPALEKIQQLLNITRKEVKNNIITDNVMLQSAKSTQHYVSVICIITVVLGIILAFFISGGIIKTLKRIASHMNDGAGQVSTASGQVSNSSQSLAEGASEQAASIEETSASLEEMSAMTQQNASNADEADSLMKEANTIVQTANRSMGELTGSMQDISHASEETSKIIKTIDEIAFQTNLLALNAAVEAARAGEAGAGFAVVADEVRNLAMRAADAAKNTSELIEGTVSKIGKGADIVQTTNDAFSKVADAASKVGRIIGEIAAASAEQFEGIEQLNKAIVEMDRVTQQNAASAEENASASEELSSQAAMMKSAVNDLIVMIGGFEKKQMVDYSEAHHSSEIDAPRLDASG